MVAQHSLLSVVCLMTFSHFSHLNASRVESLIVCEKSSDNELNLNFRFSFGAFRFTIRASDT